MKCLSLNHQESDYGESYLTLGLMQILGDNNVVTYPFKRIYYGETDTSYLLDDGTQGMTCMPDYIIPRKWNEWSYRDISLRINEFSFIILSSARTHAIKALKQLIETFGRDNLPPIVFTEHEDSDTLRTDIIKEFEPDVIFKRELPKIPTGEYRYKGKTIHPLPFSCPINSFPEADDTVKKYNVFGLFGDTHALRRKVIEKVMAMELDDVYLGLDTQDWDRNVEREKSKNLLGYKEYLTSIAQSKIALCVRGHGALTVRQNEICAYETLMMICDPGIIIPNDYKDGVNAVYFKEDLSDLEEKINYYLKHDDERIRIAKAGKEHLHNFHTNEARAQYFLDIVKEELKL